MDLVIAYASMTGNVQRFIDRLDCFDYKRKVNNDLYINRPYILITYTINFGQVPAEVKEFLSNPVNRKNLVGVVGSGNRNWGVNFCRGAKTIAQSYNVPLLHTFEMSGLNEDVEIVKREVQKLEERMFLSAKVD